MGLNSWLANIRVVQNQEEYQSRHKKLSEDYKKFKYQLVGVIEELSKLINKFSQLWQFISSLQL